MCNSSMKGKFTCCQIKAFLSSFCLFTPQVLIKGVAASLVLQTWALTGSQFLQFSFTQSSLLSSTEATTFNYSQRNKQTLVLPEVPWSPGPRDASHRRPGQLPSAAPACARALASSCSPDATWSEQPAENCCWTPTRFRSLLLAGHKQGTSLLCESFNLKIERCSTF